MPLERFLRHSLVIERSAPGARDEYGNPTQTWTTLATVRGLIQPKSALQLALLSQGGPVVSTERIYLRPTDLTESDRITSNGKTYQLDGVRNAGGADDHLEVDAHLVAVS